MAAINQFSQSSYILTTSSSAEDLIGEINHEVNQIAIQTLRNFTLDRFSSSASELVIVIALLTNLAVFLSQSGTTVTLSIVPQSFLVSGHQTSTGVIVNNTVIQSSISFNLSLILQDTLSTSSINLIEPIFYSSLFWTTNSMLTVAETLLPGAILTYDSSATFTFTTATGTPVSVPVINYYNGSYLAAATIVNTYKVNVTTSAGIVLYS